MVAALYTRVEAAAHVVTQVIEAEFVVGAVGDVGRVGFLARDHQQLVLVFVGGFFG